MYDHKSMAGLTAEQQATKAITHLFGRAIKDERLYYLIGIGSESFDLLTEAFATLTGADLAEVRKALSAEDTAPALRMLAAARAAGLPVEGASHG